MYKEVDQIDEKRMQYIDSTNETEGDAQEGERSFPLLFTPKLTASLTSPGHHSFWQQCSISLPPWVAGAAQGVPVEVNTRPGSEGAV